MKFLKEALVFAIENKKEDKSLDVVIDYTLKDYQYEIQEYVKKDIEIDIDSIENDLQCGCKINVWGDLSDLRASIDFCDEHEDNDRNGKKDMQDAINQIAEELWLKDENAKFDPKYRYIFDLAEGF